MGCDQQQNCGSESAMPGDELVETDLTLEQWDAGYEQQDDE
ncbi:unannotated protein [freshwater metagenome]|uniref:Unannotated protein n=1 Tax=freshwater metagenome TaxID=449393 RepID=A0A6J7JMW8_9ZZZZ